MAKEIPSFNALVGIAAGLNGKGPEMFLEWEFGGQRYIGIATYDPSFPERIIIASEDESGSGGTFVFDKNTLAANIRLIYPDLDAE